jgi:hypothetical protein
MVRDPAALYREYMDETPDYIPRTKPRSTVRVLGTLILTAVVILFVVVQCVRIYADSAPPRTLDVRRTELEVDVPKLYPLPSMGADRAGRTHGVWVTLRADGRVLAFASRDPASGCRVAWLTNSPLPEWPRAYRDPCRASTYTADGVAVFGPAPRDLDRYETELTATEIIVQLEHLQPGSPRAGGMGLATPPPAR